jgi:nocardicin N-oxygenase
MLPWWGPMPAQTPACLPSLGKDVMMTAEHSVRAFPLAPPGTMGPPREYDALRRECPIVRVELPMGATAWYVTRYDDVRTLLADTRLVRPTINSWPPTPEDTPPAGPGLVTMMEMEGPRHTTLRRAVAEAFSARTVRLWENQIRELAEQLLDDMEAGGRPADLISGFAEPFPLRVMCDLVGLPYEERGFYLPLADTALGALMTLEQGRAATDQLRSYVAECLGRKRRKPNHDVLTELIRRCDTGELAQEDLISFGLSMLVAGYRTSTMFIANAVLTLLTHPHQLAEVQANGRLIPNVVDELLRYLPVMNGTVVLLATEDLHIRGRTIRAGEAVLPVIAAANLDDSVFPEPDRLDLSRFPNPHLSFGRGPHNCVGMHLARAELTIALETLLNRFPNIRLAIPEHELPWEDDAPSKSPDFFPISW